jgi:ribose transport system substrate-binding protein
MTQQHVRRQRGGSPLVRLLFGSVVAAAAVAAVFAASAPAQKTKIVIGSAHPILAGQPDQQALLLGQRKASAPLGWSISPLDAQLSVDKQIADVDTFVTKKVQGITTFSMDPKASEPAYKRAKTAGIPVVGFNSAAPSVSTVIKQDIFWSCKPGQDAARFIANLRPKAKVVVMGGAQVPVLNFVVQCFVDAAKKAGLTVLDRQDNVKDQTATAQPIAVDLLTKHPDVEAWWALNDTTSAGVAAALTAAGKTIKSKTRDGVILVAGCCGSQLGADAIKAGRLSAVYDTRSPEAGAAAIKALKTVYVQKKPVSAMPKVISIAAKRYDFNNIGTYVAYTKRNLAAFAK